MGDIAAAVLASAAEREKNMPSITVEKPIGKVFLIKDPKNINVTRQFNGIFYLTFSPQKRSCDDTLVQNKKKYYENVNVFLLI